MSDRQSPGARRKVGQVLGWACLMVVFWVVFVFLDPVGIERATRESSDAFAMSITAPLYGARGPPAQQHIAVVEITDSSLGAFKETWPLTYVREAAIVRSILDAGAAGVMVDIRFAAEREGQSLSAFQPVIDLARALGVPLLFSRGEADNGYGPLPAPLTDSATLTGWTGKGLYRLLVTPEATPEEGAAAAAQPTAAFDLYERVCGKHALAACPHDVDREAFEEPMNIRWGTRFDPAQKLVSDTRGQGCYEVGDAWFARLWTAAWGGLHSLFPRFRPSARQKCFYALTIGAEQLDEPDAAGRPVSALLAGRVVFLGVDLRGERDYTDVAVFGEVPGVQVNAMAFDNLLTYGTGYFHLPQDFDLFGISMSAAEWTELAAWLLVVLVGGSLALRRAMRRRVSGVRAKRHKYRPGNHALRWVFRLLVIIGSVVIMFTLNELFLHWPTTDWIGFVLLYLALGEAREIFELEELEAREHEGPREAATADDCIEGETS